MWWYKVGMKWLGLGAGRRELKELKKATIDKRIFISGRVKLWPRVLREEAVRTLRCGGRR